jgi:hypothetical protein
MKNSSASCANLRGMVGLVEKYAKNAIIENKL